MHEVATIEAAIAQALVADGQARAGRVERLTFALAAEGHITRDTLQTLLDVLGRGTPIEGAVVELESAPAIGDELMLVSIDVDLDERLPANSRAGGAR